MQTVQRLHRSGVGVAPDRTIAHVAKVMERSGIGLVAVIDDGELLGVVTDRDLVRRGLAAGLDADSRIDAVMTSPVLAVSADADVAEASATFGRHAVRRLAVLDGTRFIGVLSLDDLLVDLAGQVNDLTAPLSVQISAPHRDRSALVEAAR